MLRSCYIKGVLEAGCDEAGRGPLAGPVFAAAVILPPTIGHTKLGHMLNDSKQLNEMERYYLRPLIERTAIAYAVAEVSNREIDEINILNASILGMHRALRQLNPQPQHIIVDGNKWKAYIPDDAIFEIPAQPFVKGDGLFMSIAAASILAKTYRDDYMVRLDRQFPQYHWKDNKGYPTKDHYDMIKQYGPSPYHRMTFRLI